MAKVWLELLCEEKGQKALVSTIEEHRFLAFTKTYLLAKQEQNIRKIKGIDRQLARAETLELKRLRFLLDYLIPRETGESLLSVGRNGDGQGQNER